MHFIENEEQLEERLSRPNEKDIAVMSRLSGDVVVLGAGGKMAAIWRNGKSLSAVCGQSLNRPGVAFAAEIFL